MNRAATLWGLVFCGAVAFAQTSTPATQASGGEAAVSQLSDNYVKTMNSGDAKALAGLFSEDGMEMPPNQPAVKGPAALEAYYQKMFTGPMKMTNFALQHIDTRAAGDLAYDVGSYRISLTPPTGAPINDVGKYVVITKQIAGAWKLTYVIYNSDQPQPPQAPQPMK